MGVVPGREPSTVGPSPCLSPVAWDCVLRGWASREAEWVQSRACLPRPGIHDSKRGWSAMRTRALRDCASPSGRDMRGMRLKCRQLSSEAGYSCRCGIACCVLCGVSRRKSPSPRPGRTGGGGGLIGALMKTVTVGMGRVRPGGAVAIQASDGGASSIEQVGRARPGQDRARAGGGPWQERERAGRHRPPARLTAGSKWRACAAPELMPWAPLMSGLVTDWRRRGGRAGPGLCPGGWLYGQVPMPRLAWLGRMGVRPAGMGRARGPGG